jgi:folate-dependent phosphoribosylglycinamide formyltransferase PurN/peptidoglycan/xylan/chitin deacetylase (PgdA/CDA1 family)
LSDADVEQVLSRGWTIGCHGHSHIPFSLMSDRELESEIESARSTLFARYGIRPAAISYPNGAIRPEQLQIIGRSFQLGFMAAPQPEEAGVLQCGRLAFPDDRHLFLESRWHSPQLSVATTFTPAGRQLSDATYEMQARDVEPRGRPRVVIMCGPLQPERAFVARVAESATVVGVFIHNYTGRELPYRRVPLDWANDAIAHLVAQDVAESDADAIWQFGWSSQYFCLRATMTVYETRDVNDPVIFPLVEALQPDVILVFGTGLIRDHRLLSLPVPKYNLHWGLSPHYRGSFTLRWPIVNDEPEKLGVTIHELTERIDGGPLVAQQVLELDGSEKAKNVEYAASAAGIAMMQEIVRLMSQGDIINSEDQDLSLGHLYPVKAWSPAHDETTEVRLEDGFAARARRSAHVAIKRLEVARAGRL